VPHRPYSVLVLHCGSSTQCLEWRPQVFIYRNFWTVLSPTFGAQPQGLLYKWVSSSAQPLALVLSTWPFLLGRIFLAVEPHRFGLQVSKQIGFSNEAQLHFLCSVRKSKYVVLSFLFSWLSSSIVAQLHTYIFFFIFTAKQENIIIIHKTLYLNISFCILS